MSTLDNTPQLTRPKPVALIILDGWGVAEESIGNAISKAQTPNFDKYCQHYFCQVLQSAGEAVGLPYGEMGSSEVGHLNIGAGKIVYQDLPRINKSIVDKSFFKNPVFIKACENVKQYQSQLHLIGLLSNRGVHASINHLFALLELAKIQEVKDVFIHVILDGRDMVYNSGLELVKDLLKKMKGIGVGKIASITGRWWAMDRDNRWDRTSAAYQAMVFGEAAEKGQDPVALIEKSYLEKVYDEEFKPTIMVDEKGEPITKVDNHDSVIFFNYRSDRARQLVRAFVLPDFDKFPRGEYLKDLYLVTMTQYEASLPTEIAFLPELVNNPLAKVISDVGLKQLHIAETEKYAHVTYFFNGGKEEPFPNEDDVLIPSPPVGNYSETPAMSIFKIKDQIFKILPDNKYDFMVINFANPDMVSHTGDLDASVKAIEAVDECLGEIVEGILSLGGVAIITADHGNAEDVVNLQTGEIDKEHSVNPVPFLIVGKDYEAPDGTGGNPNLSLLTPAGLLADIAPTVLKIMGLPQPEEMTGRSLI